MKKRAKSKTTSTMLPTGRVLLLPRALASECTIGEGLNAPSLRLAIVLTTLAFHGPNGSWDIIKPELEAMTDVVLDNADRLLEPLRTATLEKDDSIVPLFDSVSYEPGKRFKTAGVISVKLSFVARELLSSQQAVVKLPIDEFRSYATIPGVIMRLRLAARMQDLKTARHDEWQLVPEDFSNTGVFGSYSKAAMIRRTNAAGESTEYVSLSRAEAKLLAKAAEEINARSKGARVEIVPIRTAEDPKSRWLSIAIHTTKVVAGKRAQKTTMSDLNKRSSKPALAAR